MTTPGVITYYGYDRDYQRVRETGASATYYPTKNYSLTGTNSVKHIFATAGAGQTGDILIATVNSNGVHYDHIDHLTGSNVITDSSGVQEQLLDYYPFGGVRINNKDPLSQFDEKRKFAGTEYDTAIC